MVLSMESIIILAGPFTHPAALTALLSRQPYTVVRVTDFETAVDHIVEQYPALALVEGDQSSWQRWVSALKTDQATRRIPLLVITAAPHPDQPGGADGYLDRRLPDEDLLRAIRAHIRAMSPETADQLACQCRDNLPPLARLGVERFNQGAYYAQHDAFEALWMAESGPVRELYRAILQVGIAYYHITRGNHAGGLKMLRRCVQWFAVLPDECQGIDVRQLRDDAARVHAALLAIAPDEIANFDRALLKPVPRTTYD
jgi:predicted metal-dependent hydrolase/CheY-like chemotaxis protein